MESLYYYCLLWEEENYGVPLLFFSSVGNCDIPVFIGF